MYVELFGLPGSGKTTLANALARREGVVRIGVSPSYTDTALFALCHPLLTLWWLFVIIREGARAGTGSLFRTKLSMVALAFARAQKAKRSKEIAIVDEGLLQRVLSVYEHRITEEEAVRIARRLPLGDMVISMESNGSFHERLTARNNARTKLGPSYLKQWEEIAMHNASTLTRVLTKTNVSHVSVRAPEDAKVVYDAIMEKNTKSTRYV